MTMSVHERIRVLMISPQFRPIVGGYERAAERLAAGLAAVGLRVVVVTERRNREWPGMECVDGYEVQRLSCWYRRRVHTVTSLLSFARYLLRHGRDFDVWHVHQCGFHAALAVALGKVLARPVVLKLPSSGAMGIEKVLERGISGYILRRFHLGVTACLVVSEETRDEALRFGIPKERIHFIPDGLDGCQFHPVTAEERRAARSALGLDCEKLVLYVGRLSPEKNTVGLLTAWARVDPKAREGALLAIVGDGPESNLVRSSAQSLNVTGSIRLAGWRSDVAEWYRAADFYVVSSHIEGLSISMLEALASGLPVISTRVSGSTLLVEAPAAGLLVDLGNVEQLARAIETLLADDATRMRLTRNARPLFESRFSLGAFANEMISLYNSLVATERQRAA
jgi:glycosyltransferase involved in cell wall biosynthesis